MARRERERVGSFVITTAANLDPSGISCAMCGARLSSYDSASDRQIPPAETLLAAGAVPVPNFGWFCGQKCAVLYEAEFGVCFQKDATGRIRYYP